MIASGDGEMGEGRGTIFKKFSYGMLLKQCTHVILIKRLACGLIKDKSALATVVKNTPNRELIAGAGNTSAQMTG